MSGEPQRESLKNKDEVVGRYGIFYRKGRSDVGKIVRVNCEERKITYEMVSGLDKGSVFTSKFDPSQTADIYDEENLVGALMRIQE